MGKPRFVKFSGDSPSLLRLSLPQRTQGNRPRSVTAPGVRHSECIGERITISDALDSVVDIVEAFLTGSKGE